LIFVDSFPSENAHAAFWRLYHNARLIAPHNPGTPHHGRRCRTMRP
jgi:hypothetical protein